MSVWLLCLGKMQNGRKDLLKDLKKQSEPGFNIQQSLIKGNYKLLKGVSEV